jgi:hypothetical protein
MAIGSYLATAPRVLTPEEEAAIAAEAAAAQGQPAAAPPPPPEGQAVAPGATQTTTAPAPAQEYVAPPPAETYQYGEPTSYADPQQQAAPVSDMQAPSPQPVALGATQTTQPQYQASAPAETADSWGVPTTDSQTHRPTNPPEIVPGGVNYNAAEDKRAQANPTALTPTWGTIPSLVGNALPAIFGESERTTTGSPRGQTDPAIPSDTVRRRQDAVGTWLQERRGSGGYDLMDAIAKTGPGIDQFVNERVAPALIGGSGSNILLDPGTYPIGADFIFNDDTKVLDTAGSMQAVGQGYQGQPLSDALTLAPTPGEKYRASPVPTPPDRSEENANFDAILATPMPGATADTEAPAAMRFGGWGADLLREAATNGTDAATGKASRDTFSKATDLTGMGVDGLRKVVADPNTPAGVKAQAQTLLDGYSVSNVRVGQEAAQRAGEVPRPSLTLPTLPQRESGRAPYTQAEQLRVFGQTDAGISAYPVQRTPEPPQKGGRVPYEGIPNYTSPTDVDIERLPRATLSPPETPGSRYRAPEPSLEDRARGAVQDVVDADAGENVILPAIAGGKRRVEEKIYETVDPETFDPKRTATDAFERVRTNSADTVLQTPAGPIDYGDALNKGRGAVKTVGEAVAGKVAEYRPRNVGVGAQEASPPTWAEARDAMRAGLWTGSDPSKAGLAPGGTQSATGLQADEREQVGAASGATLIVGPDGKDIRGVKRADGTIDRFEEGITPEAAQARITAAMGAGTTATDPGTTSTTPTNPPVLDAQGNVTKTPQAATTPQPASQGEISVNNSGGGSGWVDYGNNRSSGGGGQRSYDYPRSSSKRSTSVGQMFADDGDEMDLNDFLKDYNGNGEVDEEDRRTAGKRFASYKKKRGRKGKTSTSSKSGFSNVPQREDSPIRTKTLNAIKTSTRKSGKR